jgi:hypothetical protein
MRSLSPDTIERFTGKTASHFYKVCHPNSRAGLYLQDAARLDAALQAEGRAPRFLPLHQDIARALVDGEGAEHDIERSLRRVMVETGELAAAVDAAMEDGKLDLEERRILTREAQDVMDAAQAIRDAIEPPFEVVGREVG